MTEAEDRATADMHPCIPTDTDPCPPQGIVRPPCPATRGGGL